ncbi:MAG TPA: PilN domain-containing protein [Bryobacteraceae bacterium]|nr:PilN domain-containing protein [Bryobacteraceae bacterium]
MNPIDFKKWLAIGTGVGIEIGRDDLSITVVRVRPSGVQVLGEMNIPRFREQPATEWGADYTNFLKKLGVAHLAATALLPRDEMMVRQVALPGVTDKDLAAAIRFEIDSLNPYSEEEAVFDWARIGKTSSILVGFTRRSVLERYTTLFAEAGVKIASFTFAAPAIYTSVRLLSIPPPEGFVVVEEYAGEMEVYGESPARPMFSARLDGSPAKAATLAISELRLAPETSPSTLLQILPKPLAAPAGYDVSRSALSYATALAGACPFRPLAVNLLPPEQRQSSSRMRYVPTIALATVLLLLAGAVIAYPKISDRKYRGLLQAEIRKLEPKAKKAADLDRQLSLTVNHAQVLDNFRRHSRDDMDALNELTKILVPPSWLSSLQLTRDSVTINGETDQAAALLKVLDSSHQFRGSSFAFPMQRGQNGEVFTIRAVRQGITP